MVPIVRYIFLGYTHAFFVIVAFVVGEVDGCVRDLLVDLRTFMAIVPAEIYEIVDIRRRNGGLRGGATEKLRLC